ncbi:hypothetical protein V6N13_049357 [Hibiscus sabdariffa]
MNRWSPPSSPWVCLNTDGSVRPRSKYTRAGGVIRDNSGAWVVDFGRGVGIVDAFTSELWAIYDGTKADITPKKEKQQSSHCPKDIGLRATCGSTYFVVHLLQCLRFNLPVHQSYWESLEEEEEESFSSISGFWKMEVVDHKTHNFENGQAAEEEEEVDEDANVLQFMDSMDAYLTLIHSLSSTLRQGWLELASARHSMGAYRVNTVLLDHTSHPAATSLLVDEGKEPHFTLCKWGSSGNEKLFLGEEQSSRDKSHPQIRRRGATQLSEEKTTSENKASCEIDDPVQKERSKSLSVFGTLVSPKLRAAQLSFETALETLVEIANRRSEMLCAFDKVNKKSGGSKD